jgi:hypothetical protein
MPEPDPCETQAYDADVKVVAGRPGGVIAACPSLARHEPHGNPSSLSTLGGVLLIRASGTVNL